MTDETKIRLFGQNQKWYAWWEKKTTFQEKNLLPTEVWSGSIMLWGCVDSSGAFNPVSVGRFVGIMFKNQEVEYTPRIDIPVRKLSKCRKHLDNPGKRKHFVSRSGPKSPGDSPKQNAQGLLIGLKKCFQGVINAK